MRPDVGNPHDAIAAYELDSEVGSIPIANTDAMHHELQAAQLID